MFVTTFWTTQNLIIDIDNLAETDIPSNKVEITIIDK